MNTPTPARYCGQRPVLRQARSVTTATAAIIMWILFRRWSISRVTGSLYGQLRHPRQDCGRSPVQSAAESYRRKRFRCFLLQQRPQIQARQRILTRIHISIPTLTRLRQRRLVLPREKKLTPAPSAAAHLRPLSPLPTIQAGVRLRQTVTAVIPERLKQSAISAERLFLLKRFPTTTNGVHGQ